jgi:hypothetical protein
MRPLALALVLALSLTGCLRTKFDLCIQTPPDPSCAYLDASNDGGSDAATVDAAPSPDGGLDASADATTD